MRRYVINGCIMSKWTNQFLSYAEDAVGRELDEDEVMGGQVSFMSGSSAMVAAHRTESG